MEAKIVPVSLMSLKVAIGVEIKILQLCSPKINLGLGMFESLRCLLIAATNMVAEVHARTRAHTGGPVIPGEILVKLLHFFHIARQVLWCTDL